MASESNCKGCLVWEEPGTPGSQFFVDSTVIHELGHCAMALGHIDRPWDADGDGFYEPTSFTLSANAASTTSALSAGADGIRGSADDDHQAPMGMIADSVSWFRRADNDPFVVDSTIIDIDTYSRSVAANLPPGDTWAANGNQTVGYLLGYFDTQSVMYSLTESKQRFLSLSADDVNMVKMAQTGVDLMAGTADDYTVDLQYVGICGAPGSYDIRILFAALAPGTLGVCTASAIDYSFDPGNPLLARHFSLVDGPFDIGISEAENWIFGDAASAIFVDGFDSGNTGAWSPTP